MLASALGLLIKNLIRATERCCASVAMIVAVLLGMIRRHVVVFMLMRCRIPAVLVRMRMGKMVVAVLMRMVGLAAVMAVLMRVRNPFVRMLVIAL